MKIKSLDIKIRRPTSRELDTLDKDRAIAQALPESREILITDILGRSKDYRDAVVLHEFGHILKGKLDSSTLRQELAASYFVLTIKPSNEPAKDSIRVLRHKAMNQGYLLPVLRILENLAMRDAGYTGKPVSN